MPQLRVLYRIDPSAELVREGDSRGGTALGERGRPLDLLTDPKANGVHPEPEGSEALEQLVRQQRELLRPRGRGHENGQDAAAQRTRLGAAGDAVSEEASPGVAVDGDARMLCRHDSCSVEQLAQSLRAGAGLHEARGTLRGACVNRCLRPRADQSGGAVLLGGR